jgi:hypothetical protein
MGGGGGVEEPGKSAVKYVFIFQYTVCMYVKTSEILGKITHPYDTFMENWFFSHYLVSWHWQASTFFTEIVDTLAVLAVKER